MEDDLSKVAEADLDLNNALVNADIRLGYEEYLALFDHFYDVNVESARPAYFPSFSTS
jgi:hypothetical protein